MRHPSLPLLLMVFAGLGAAGCGDGAKVEPCSAAIGCTTDQLCLPSPASQSSFCTAADTRCASGRRWDTSAGDDLSDTCFAPTVLGLVAGPCDPAFGDVALGS